MKESKLGFIKFNESLMGDYELKVGETLVYGALVSFRNMSIQSKTTDEQGQVYAYPPISSIANITGQSERSVKSHIQALEEKGLMTVQRSYKEGSKEKNVNRYYLNTDVLNAYFTIGAKETSKAKPIVKSKADTKKIPKQLKQTVFIANADVEEWFNYYQGEHNNNSAMKLNELSETYGAETVVKAIHNVMNGVNISTLSQGTTGFILSRLHKETLGDAKRQLQNKEERRERFMNEPITPVRDYTEHLKRRENKRKIRDDVDTSQLSGGLL
ncbi:TPA: helix-turn-helix domain-containing protein [Bacillus cereus]|nr:helix-turn-helix domain-containing protein [Bacillus cereus]HDR8266542.1 helix-turn-helix domain-containing protein [Bacillus cereus]HDR8269990.1 helix-turn-helix domain-containing protein [Bacillus cereus]HDR8275356.1 helix-turn-helix domain-containing protein [Bacillus cereus]HDR8283117.1 helix-turn-helix domain-containing protein [Bacillus cereus]